MGESIYFSTGCTRLKLKEVINYVDSYHLVSKKISYLYAKRALDLTLSIVLLLLFFPIFALAAAAVRLTSKGPIFYKSYRLGLCGKPFLFIKFRSMCEGADQLVDTLANKNQQKGPIFKMENDPRITSVGRFLRKYSIDELPQLLGVFLGPLSMVGPRPPLLNEVLQYDERAMKRLTVKPGLTCYWQIMGRSNLSFEKWLELDLNYIEEMSFWVDLKILLRTPAAVIKAEGAY